MCVLMYNNVYAFLFCVCMYIYIYISEHKDQNNVKEKSKCEITIYFKASKNILSRKNKDIKINPVIPKYKVQ